jgi:hypothetical protein
VVYMVGIGSELAAVVRPALIARSAGAVKYRRTCHFANYLA